MTLYRYYCCDTDRRQTLLFYGTRRHGSSISCRCYVQKSGITPPSRTCTLINTQTLTDVTEPMTKKYFPNNYDRVAKAPASWFMSLPYDDFMEWKMNGWEIPASHDCIIRTINCKTGKIKEFVYQQHKSAK